MSQSARSKVITNLRGDLRAAHRTVKALRRDIIDLVDILRRVTDLAVELGATNSDLIKDARDHVRYLGKLR